MDSLCAETVGNLFPGPVKIKHKSDDTNPQESRSLAIEYLNPFTFINGGIPLHYFNIGVATYILTSPISYYMIDTLDTSATQYSAYSTLLTIPWSLKFLFGMVTDGFPIMSYRRKSWLFIGWAGYTALAFFMSGFAAPGFSLLAGVTILQTVLYLQADVCADSLCVERARLETLKLKGTLQTSAYTIRSFGYVLGALFGALLYNTDDWGWGLTLAQLFLLSALVPVTGLLPAIYSLNELEAPCAAPSIMDQIMNIWNTLQKHAVIYPVSFIYIYGIFQVPNQAWTNFLIEGKPLFVNMYMHVSPQGI